MFPNGNGSMKNEIIFHLLVGKREFTRIASKFAVQSSWGYRPEKAYLESGRNVSDLIREQRSPLRQGKTAGAVADGVGECPREMSEKLGFQECIR